MFSARVSQVGAALSLALLLVVAEVSPAAAEPGDLDPTFGTDGVAFVYAGGETCNSEGTAVAIDPAGSIVVGGFASSSTPEGVNQELAVTRLTPSGGPDDSFGTDGVATIPLSSLEHPITFARPTALAVQPDRRVVVLAELQELDESWNVQEMHRYLVRLTADGQLDPTFGTNGRTELLPAGRAEGRSLTIDGSGATLLGGRMWPANPGAPTPFVARFTGAGHLDPAFGIGGVALLAGPGSVDAVGTAPDGRIMAGVGVEDITGAGSTSWFTVRRLTPTGAVDGSFASGEATVPVPPASLVRSLLPGQDGSLIVVGALGRDPLVAKFTPEGALDDTFGRGGFVDFSVPGGMYDIESSGVVLPDGKILVGGPGFMVRLLPDGRPDRTFGSGGLVLPAIPFQVQTGPALQSDGKAVFAGVVHGCSRSDMQGDQMAVTRVMLGSGSPVPPADTTARVAGEDRIATAIAASRATFSEPGGSGDGRLTAGGSVVLVSADSFADALVAAPFVRDSHMPVLLTHKHSLDPRVLGEIRRLLGEGLGTIIRVIGGPAVVSDDVVDALIAEGYEVERIAGADRYETAVAVAEWLGAGIVFEVDGRSFADAVVAGAAGAQLGGAVLFTEGATPAWPTMDYVWRPGIVRYAIGGAAAAADPAATPIVGVNRYDTAAKVADAFFSTPSYAAIATGSRFPDALVAGVRAGLVGGPVLLTRPGDLPPPAAAWLASRSAWIDAAEVFGGTAAVSNGVVATVDEAIG